MQVEQHQVAVRQEPLVPPGKLHVFSETRAPNTLTTKKEAAASSMRISSREAMLDAFFRQDKNENISYITHVAGGKVSLLRPTSPYTPATQMGIAAPKEFFNPQSDQELFYRTHTIYDLPPDVQRAYWQMMMECLKQYESHHPELFRGKKGEVLAMENMMSTTSIDRVRSPRTVVWPHFHVCAVDFSQLLHSKDLTSQELLHAAYERRVVEMLVKRIIPDLNITELFSASTLKQIVEGPVMGLAAPVGYSFTLDKDTTPEQFAQFMREHQAAYKRIVTPLDKKYGSHLQRPGHSKAKEIDNHIPSPSYRLYVRINDEDHIEVHFSPVFASHKGVMEGLGIDMDRGPENPRTLDEADLKSIQADIISSLILSPARA